MRRLITVVLLLLVGFGVAYSQELQETKELSVKPKDGFVPNAETAVKIAEAVLIPVYGEKKINEERPFKATRQGDIWRVTGTLNCDSPNCEGGTAVVRISKPTGEILFVGHYK
jgi:hypothetical protein